MLIRRGTETSLRMNLRAWYHVPKCSNQRQVRDIAVVAVVDVTASVFAATNDERARLFRLWFWLPPCSVDGSSSMFACSSFRGASSVKNVNIRIFDY